MFWQTLFTALIVAASAGWAAWQLMPATLRARCRAALGLHAVAATGCGGCGGCSPAAKPRADGAQVVKIVRRAGRAS